MPNAAALAAEYVPLRRRPLAVTLTIVCVPLGGTLAGLFAIPALPALGWRTLFLIGGIVPVVAAVVLERLLPESPRYLARHPNRWPELRRVLARMGHQRSRGRHVRRERRRAPLHRAGFRALFDREFRIDTMALWGAFFSCLLAVYLGFSWLPSILTGAGLGPAVASSGITAFNLGGVVGAIAGGLFIARFGSRPTMLAMTAGAIAGAVVLSLMTLDAGAVTLDPDHADDHRRADQRGADDDVRAGGARVPDTDACNRGWCRGVVRSHRRDSQRLRRAVGARAATAARRSSR